MDAAQARERFARSPVLRLATAGADARPHIVPCTFAIDDAGRVVIGIDHKPKSTAQLRRIRNIEQNSRVSMLADHYSGDWPELWWARADGSAMIERSGAEHGAHWDLLRAKYPQYEGQLLAGPVIVVAIEAWSGWAFGPTA
jgi:PPOX class probable F420-dependent enzyme